MTNEIQVTADDLLANSYRDFHTKGLHYLCLKRSESETIKVYFFDGDVSHLPEVVAPHDHRYCFITKCLSGVVTNKQFYPSLEGKIYQKFEYLTPLNGGSGFKWVGEYAISERRSETYAVGASPYLMMAQEYHTIRIDAPETILMLVQFKDVVPIGVPTTTFILNREPPSLSGLYNKFTIDEAMRWLEVLSEKSDLRVRVI